MSFASLKFLVFFPVSLMIYYIVPKKYQWVWLLIGSYVFYAFSSPVFIVFLLLSTVITYLSALYIGRINDARKLYFDSHPGLTTEQKKEYVYFSDKRKKLCLFTAIVVSVGILFVLKYLNFTIHSINMLGASIPNIEWVILPLGISFYTFQSLGYNIDVYRGVADPQKNFFKYALFVSFFLQIAQGPIGRYNDLSPQLFEGHVFDYNKVTSAAWRILVGFFKKLVIAARLGVIVDFVYQSYAGYSGIVLCFATFLYAFQIYMDFSGYMDIAIGCSESMGIRLAENFDRPYLSKSIAEFWRRWHITLGTWLKDYVFFSVLRTNWCTGLAKKISKSGHKNMAKTLPTVIALLVTWTLTGLWHGAGWKFLFYGLYHGSFIIFSVILERPYKRIWNILHINPQSTWIRGFQVVRTFCIVTFGYIFFRSESLSAAFTIIRKMASKSILNIGSLLSFVLSLKSHMLESIFCGCFALGCYLLFVIFDSKFRLKEKITNGNMVVRWSSLYVLLLTILLLGCYGSNMSGSFIYFNF